MASSRKYDFGTDGEKALEALLNALGGQRIQSKERIIKELKRTDIESWENPVRYTQITKTRYTFWGISKFLRLYTWTDVFVVEMDLSKEDKLYNYISKQYRRGAEGMFEFEKDDNCIVAYD